MLGVCGCGSRHATRPALERAGGRKPAKMRGHFSERKAGASPPSLRGLAPLG
ncbi:hypothetical protein [Helicobacter bizzozeronii]|uniref:hypothetical protein n=1 Tax=Helicobacter bizzozeronii TaxID=56877 RepID=UPI002552AD7F|nr:hypothetical protein [Helicobacter bizzozeronii]